jgi:hypothetical protein
MTSSKATHLELDLTSDLQKWRAFLAIAELGSLTRAALFLDSNQSLLSRHLNALERECNARLFNRTGRGVTLSDFGQRIAKIALPLPSEPRRFGVLWLRASPRLRLIEGFVDSAGQVRGGKRTSRRSAATGEAQKSRL